MNEATEQALTLLQELEQKRNEQSKLLNELRHRLLLNRVLPERFHRGTLTTCLIGTMGVGGVSGARREQVARRQLSLKITREGENAASESVTVPCLVLPDEIWASVWKGVRPR